MATYVELRNLFSDDTLENRVTTATVIAAQALLDGTPTANDRAWALSVLEDPDGWGIKIFKSVLAANKNASVATIQGASDATIQSAVDAVVPQIVLAYSGG